MGVVYHANYLVWCEIGRTDLIRSAGKSYAQIEQDGVLLAVSDANIRFLSPARYDDPIVVRTRLVELRSRSLKFAYQIRNEESQRILVTATTSLVSLDETSRPVRLPQQLVSVLEPVLTNEFSRDD